MSRPRRVAAAIAPSIAPLPPKEALAFFRQKGLVDSFSHEDIEGEEHAHAFAVAKATVADVLADIRAGVDQALAEGRTLGQFSQDLTPILQAKGWYGKQVVVDPLTDEPQLAQLGSPARLALIYRTNLRSAYAAGQWQRIWETRQAYPFLRFHHTDQEHPRLEHEAWGAQPVILAVNHPWWNTHYPPCDYECKCWVSQLNQRQLERMGLKVTAKPIAFPGVLHTNRRTGEESVVERGIGYSFNFNVGKAYLDPLTPRAAPASMTTAGPGLLTPPSPPLQKADASGSPPPPRRKRSPPPPPPLPAARPGPALLDEAADQAEAVADFLARFGAQSKARVFIDKAGEPFTVGPALFQDGASRDIEIPLATRRALPLAAQAIAEPDEIRMVWREVEGQAARPVRRYIAHLVVDGEPVVVVVDQLLGSGSIWAFTTSLEAGFDLAALRLGDVTWSRVAPQEDS